MVIESKLCIWKSFKRRSRKVQPGSRQTNGRYLIWKINKNIKIISYYTCLVWNLKFFLLQMDKKNRTSSGNKLWQHFTPFMSPTSTLNREKKNANFPSLGKATGALLINVGAKNYASLAWFRYDLSFGLFSNKDYCVTPCVKTICKILSDPWNLQSNPYKSQAYCLLILSNRKKPRL